MSAIKKIKDAISPPIKGPESGTAVGAEMQTVSHAPREGISNLLKHEDLLEAQNPQPGKPMKAPEIDEATLEQLKEERARRKEELERERTKKSE